MVPHGRGLLHYPEGGGIYRHVHLVKADHLHIEQVTIAIKV